MTDHEETTKAVTKMKNVNLGQIGIGGILTAAGVVTFAAISWLAGTVYSSIDTRVTKVESATVQQQAAIVSVQTDVRWIKSALQSKGFRSPEDVASSSYLNGQ